jgi:SAM-dependent methyltransferase
LLKYWYRLVRLGFRLLYNEFAFTYDTVSGVVSMGAWRCWGRSALKHLNADPNDWLLEIAHGTGNLQLDLHGAGYRAVGVDLSPQMGGITARKLRAAKRIPRLARSIAQALPFPNATFSAVVSTFPADFIIAPETLREVHRVLKPDGHFVIVPNAVFTSTDAGAQGLELLYRITGQREESPTDRHTRPKFDMVAYFASFGFDVTVHQEPCPRSMATVIVVEKQTFAASPQK